MPSSPPPSAAALPLVPRAPVWTPACLLPAARRPAARTSALNSAHRTLEPSQSPAAGILLRSLSFPIHPAVARDLDCPIQRLTGWWHLGPGLQA